MSTSRIQGLIDTVNRVECKVDKIESTVSEVVAWKSKMEGISEGKKEAGTSANNYKMAFIAVLSILVSGVIAVFIGKV